MLVVDDPRSFALAHWQRFITDRLLARMRRVSLHAEHLKIQKTAHNIAFILYFVICLKLPAVRALHNQGDFVNA